MGVNLAAPWLKFFFILEQVHKNSPFMMVKLCRVKRFTEIESKFPTLGEWFPSMKLLKSFDEPSTRLKESNLMTQYFKPGQNYGTTTITIMALSFRSQNEYAGRCRFSD